MTAIGWHEFKNNNFQWVTFVCLYLLTLASQIAFPLYQAVQQGENYLPQLLPSLVFLSILGIPTIAIGLFLGPRLGIGIINQKSQHQVWSGLGIAVVAGMLLGGLLLLLRVWLASYLPDEIPAYGFRGFVGGVLVSFGAAVGEEIFFRFGLLTLLLFMVQKWRKTPVSNTVFWSVVVVVSVLFGAAHLPQLLSYGAETSFAVSATIIGNVMVSLLFSWCFWRFGLASAMVAHFSVDIVLHAFSAVL